MRVIVHLSRFYNWEDVEPDVVLKPEEIAGPLIMPGRLPGQYKMRVERPGPKHRGVFMSEATIINKIIDERVDVRRSGQIISRRQAAAHVVRLSLDDGRYAHAVWDWITGFEVHDDGPSEELIRAKLEPHATAVHGRTGRVHIPGDEHDAIVAAYMEPADAQAHVDHMHAHFRVKKKETT
jgi:hypothetical protein